MNPELQRYLWLELTGHRLVATPVVLGLVFGFLHLVFDWSGGTTFAAAGWFLAAAIGVLWGARSAADSVVGEVRDGTWDQQRLSSQGPWSLTWAKLVGAPVFAWYAIAPCLVLMVLGASEGMPPAAAAGHAAVLVLALLFAHAIGLLTSLFLAAGGGTGLGRAAAGLHLTGLIAALPLLGAAWGGFFDGWHGSVVWFSIPVAGGAFVVASMVLAAAWAVTGCYRLMRAELQLRNAPWVWLGFSLFLMAYLAGFPWEERSVGAGSGWRAELVTRSGASAFAAHVTALGLGYLSLFTQPKDPVTLRRLLAALRAGATARALEVLPRWTWSVPLASLTLAWAVVSGALVEVCASSLLFFVRDAGLVVLLNLSRRRERADMAALLYLLVLYALLPGILEAALGVSTAGWLRPSMAQDIDLPAAVVPSAVQAAALWYLVARRWRREWHVSARPLTEMAR